MPDADPRTSSCTNALVAAGASSAPALAGLLTASGAIDEHAIIAVTDVRGRIIEVNQRFCDISQYDRDELIGQDHRIVNSGFHPKSYFRQMWRTILEGRIWRGDLCNRTKGGSIYWVQTTIVPVRGDDGAPSHFISLRTDITEQKLLQEALSRTRDELESRILSRTEALNRSKNDLSTILDSLADGVIAVDGLARVIRINPAARSLTGWSADDAVGQAVSMVLDVADAATGASVPCPVLRALASRSVVNLDGLITLTSRNGRQHLITGNCAPIRDDDGGVNGAVLVIRDVSEFVRQKEALAKSEERYAMAARGANDGLWDWDLKRNSLFLSERWQAIAGLTGASTVQDAAFWLDRVHPHDRSQLEADIEICKNGDEGHLRNEHRLRHPDGSWRHVLCTAIMIRDAKGDACRMVGSLCDISQRKAAEAQLLYDSTHDSLTGLPNRTLFRHRLDSALRRARSDARHRIAVLFLDLDRFKTINDSLGHHIGDELLMHAGRIMRGIVMPTDSHSSVAAGNTVARMGGDEFTVLLQPISGIDEVTRLADRLQEALSLPVEIDGHEVCTSASIGIRLLDDPGCTPEDILRDADTAMYRSKSAGKARYTLFDRLMHEQVKSRLQMEADLRYALDRHEMQLHYQPIISLVHGGIIGFESLMRWRHPRLGMVSPAEFIPLAEESGLIKSLGRWALLQSARQLQAWQKRWPDSPLSISVNLSRRQLADSDIVDDVSAAIALHHIPPHSLKLEVTESVVVENIHAAGIALRQLKDLGVQVHMDDFGTGYSSLSCLHQFPLDGIKIDRSFIQHMSGQTDYSAVVHAIITLAHNMRMCVTAEGIESSEQLVQLQALDCDEGQGYWFARPMDAAAAERFLEPRLSISPAPDAHDDVRCAG